MDIYEEHELHRFWHQLYDEVERDSPQNRLIVLIPVNSEWGLPNGLIPLHSPRFRVGEVRRWVGQIVDSLSWSESKKQDAFQRWTNHIMDECSDHGELQIDLMYLHLKEMLDWLKQRPTFEQFEQEIERRRHLYVPASD